MDVILLQKVENLGDLGDRVKVKSGYGRNYLIPSGKAAPASSENIARFEAQRADLERQAAAALADAQARCETLNGLAVTLSAKAGAEGKLYGSIGTIDIAKAITDAGVAVHKHEVRLPTGPLRQTGNHEITLHLHTDVNVQVTISIVAEE